MFSSVQTGSSPPIWCRHMLGLILNNSHAAHTYLVLSGPLKPRLHCSFSLSLSFLSFPALYFFPSRFSPSRALSLSLSLSLSFSLFSYQFNSIMIYWNDNKIKNKKYVSLFLYLYCPSLFLSLPISGSGGCRDIYSIQMLSHPLTPTSAFSTLLSSEGQQWSRERRRPWACDQGHAEEATKEDCSVIPKKTWKNSVWCNISLRALMFWHTEQYTLDALISQSVFTKTSLHTAQTLV